MSEFVFTCQQDSEQLCLNEMNKLNIGVKLLKWLDAGVGLAECGNKFSDISKIFREAKPVFTRHVFPVEFAMDCADCFDCADFDGMINKYKEKIGRNKTFSVQIRNRTENKTYSCSIKDIKVYIIDCFVNAGYLYDKANPGIIISAFISGGKIYAGLSTGEENLSIWSGGMRHYAFNGQVISRAEFKLLELFEYFPDILKNPGNALDLGASPGGWTKILIEKGCKVTAIDPNKLDGVLLKNPNVEYHKGLAENFIELVRKKPGFFDLAVNDMRMHAVQSAKIMIKAYDWLKDGGYAVMTLKLNKSGKTAAIKDALNILKEKYNILFMKQLFHNRLEITVVLGKNIF